MRWLDPVDCAAARDCLERGNVREAAKLLLNSPHRRHRAARLLLLDISTRLVEEAAQAFGRGEIHAAWTGRNGWAGLSPARRRRKHCRCESTIRLKPGSPGFNHEDSRRIIVMTPEEDFTSVYSARYSQLCALIARKFPGLGEACEDVAQTVYQETFAKIRGQGFTPNQDWWAYLCWLAKKRAMDYLRQIERRAFEALSSRDENSSDGPWEPPDSAPSPS